MTSVGYGWAHPLVRALCEKQHRNIGFCLGADRPTRFYILLALRGWEHRSDDIPFEQFADDISSQSRRAFLTRLWGHDLGPMTALKLMSGPPWARAALDDLAEALKDVGLRRVINTQSKVTPKKLRLLSDIPSDARSPTHVEFIMRFGLEETIYVLEGIKRQSPSLTSAAALTILSGAKRKRDLEEHLHRALIDVPFPPPPWLGTPTFTPLRTMRVVKQTGQLFGNCLVDPDQGFQALSGISVIYVVDVKGIPFCAQVKRDRVFRSWRVHEIKGLQNELPTRAQQQIMVSTFAEAGLPYIPKSPFEFWFD